uniref:Uncharacterized protein n=1 Tax=Cyprinus carpio TaxID=7962 RepID=A0A8C1J6X5_CYPCA
MLRKVIYTIVKTTGTSLCNIHSPEQLKKFDYAIENGSCIQEFRRPVSKNPQAQLLRGFHSSIYHSTRRLERLRGYIQQCRINPRDT